jgi:hypothetical protein
MMRSRFPAFRQELLASPLARRVREMRKPIGVGVIVLVLVNLWTWGWLSNDVLDAAYSFPDGGGYCALSDSGVLRTIKHDGSVILPASNGGSYCCGFTFEVAMKVAEERGLLKNKSVEEVRKFQRDWNGVTKGTEKTQCAAAVENLGIGHEIKPADAQPGDFLCFFRTSGIGHSVVFLNWMKTKDGHVVGFHYRSSQPSTDGVGESFEYVSDSGMGNVLRDTMHLARLNHRWWSHVIYPFSS